MRTPLRRKSRIYQGQVSSTTTHPAPVGGWNARDALAAMKTTDAVTLENWFPQTSYVEIRGGYASHATGMTGNGKTLATYNALDGGNEMYCLTASGVYDVTSAGAVGASKAARTSGKHQWVMFGDGTNNYLILCNGTDKPLYYVGTSWTAVDGASSPALTGVTTTNLIAPFVSKGRLYFIQKETLSYWYLAAGAAGGALTEFDLSGVTKKGGYLMAGATWTIDAGDGPDDRVVFVTSEGEAIVYAGTNPGSAASWGLVGVYDIGRPLGRRCLEKYGGDLIVVTQNGAFPLASALQSATVDYKLALSFKIERAFNDAANSYGTVFGWQPIVYPKRSALIVNVPQTEDGVHEQYVMNTITKAWCKFTGWDAECFGILDGQLYFADGTVVYKAWTGQVDGTSNIVAYGKTAFSSFQRPGTLKKFSMFRPTLDVSGPLTFLTDLDIDFADTPMSGAATYATISQALWGTALWGTGLWSSGSEIVTTWTSPAAYPGYWAAGKLQVETNSYTVKWMSSDYIWEYGGPLG